MLPAAIKQQYSSVLPSLHHCLPIFDEICRTAMDFVFFVRVTLIKIGNRPLDMSAALVLFVINWTHFSCTGIWQIRLEIWPELDLVGFPKNGRIPDFPEPKSGTTRFFPSSKICSFLCEWRHFVIGVGAQSTLGGTTFLPEKYVWKNNKMSEFYIILAWKN